MGFDFAYYDDYLGAVDGKNLVEAPDPQRHRRIR